MINDWSRSWLVLIGILLFILTPLSFDLDFGGISVTAAFAKNGNGNGNGGGGSGHGHSGDAKGASAHEQAHSAGLGHQKQDAPSAKSKGMGVSQLGRLNAAHASPNAREHAAPNSAVGRIAAYEMAVHQRQEVQLELESLVEDKSATSQQIEDAHLALEDAVQLEVETLSEAANKEVNVDVAQAVNEMLGIESLERTGSGY